MNSVSDTAVPFTTLLTFRCQEAHKDEVVDLLCRKAREQTPDVAARVDVLQSRDNDNIIIAVVVQKEKADGTEWVDVIDPTFLEEVHFLEYDCAAFPTHPADFSVFAPRGHAISTEILAFLVHFYINPNSIDDFREMLIAEAALVAELEPDNVRFDLLQCSDDPTRWLVYEILADNAALQYHSQMPHYLKVREALIKMQAKPRSHDKGYCVLFPTPCASAET